MNYSGRYDLKALAKLMDARTPDSGVIIVYEKLHAMPMKGSIAAHERGYAQGMIEAMASTLALPMVGVAPQRWQKEMLPEEYTDTKKAALEVALEKFPYIDLSNGKFKEESAKCERKPHSGIVDALLIAEWGRMNL